ncbi:hypothetical protein BDV29DRAFT_157645 [Aspergillus leporis]|uniref:Cyanovirin-N domain-containing protein n=1 Tax=Aspergillus leporis TaxID=41062 RepID=A0A5N5X071_9EURO|nr:hypothetical protein BDV29DRAFT_157645 [Aspergillus leporis]
MRATISLALLAALPAALAAGTCREGLEYCGSTLLWHGWNHTELLDISDGDGKVESALFYCEMNGLVDYSGPCEVCSRAMEGRSDTCDQDQGNVIM